MDFLGEANGWNVWPLENGDWGWSAWVASNGGLPQSGVEEAEALALAAAQRELERMTSAAQTAAQSRRELFPTDSAEERWDPQS